MEEQENRNKKKKERREEETREKKGKGFCIRKRTWENKFKKGKNCKRMQPSKERERR